MKRRIKVRLRKQRYARLRPEKITTFSGRWKKVDLQQESGKPLPDICFACPGIIPEIYTWKKRMGCRRKSPRLDTNRQHRLHEKEIDAGQEKKIRNCIYVNSRPAVPPASTCITVCLFK